MSTTNVIETDLAPFDLIGDMENDLYSIVDFAHALATLGQSINNNDGAAVSRVAFAIKDIAEKAEAKRDKAWHALNPNGRGAAQ